MPTLKRIVLIFCINLLVVDGARAQWHNADNLHCGGSITCLVAKESKIFAGSWEGVYVSTNKGKHWDKFGPSNILSIILKDSLIFAGTYSQGVYRSGDYGKSWTKMNEGIPGKYIHVNTLHTDGLNIYAGLGRNGVYVSDDNGESWTAIKTGMENADIRCIITRDTTIFAAAYLEGVYKSSDNGKSWNLFNEGFNNTGLYSMAHNDSAIFVGTINGLFISTDEGETWHSSDEGISYKGIETLAANGPNIFAGTSRGIFKSENNGLNWQLANSNLLIHRVSDIYIDSDDVYASAEYPHAASGGVFLSDDKGDNWDVVGVDDAFVWWFLKVEDKILAATFGSGVFVSEDNGESWEGKNHGLGNLKIRSITGNDTLIVVGTERGVYISSDFGDYWETRNQGIELENIKAVAIKDKNIFAGTYERGIFKSSDDGLSWTLTNNNLTNIHVYSLAVHGKYIFAGTNSGIYRSEDDGENWVGINDAFSPIYAPVINSFSIIGKLIYASTGDGLFVSENFGDQWVKLGITDRVITLLYDEESLFALSPKYLSVSIDLGKTWTRVDNNGMSDNDFRSACLAGDQIITGAFGGGLYKRALLVTANDMVICTGASVDLQAEQTLGNKSNTTFSWSTGETSTAITVTPEETTTYTVTAKNEFYTDSVQVTVTVNPVPNMVIDSATICYGDSTMLVAKGTRSYLWDNGERNNWIIVKPDTTTEFMVIGRNNGIGCIDTAFASVKVNPLPTTPTISLLGDTIFSSAKLGNQWYWEDYHIWGANDTSLVYQQNGNYFTIVTLEGCSSDTSNIINILKVAVEQQKSTAGVKIYPNPVTDFLKIETSGKAAINISTLNGQVLKSFVGVTYNLEIDLTHLPNSIYLINVTTEKGTISEKVIKQ